MKKSAPAELEGFLNGWPGRMTLELIRPTKKSDTSHEPHLAMAREAAQLATQVRL